MSTERIITLPDLDVFHEEVVKLRSNPPKTRIQVSLGTGSTGSVVLVDIDDKRMVFYEDMLRRRSHEEQHQFMLDVEEIERMYHEFRKNHS